MQITKDFLIDCNSMHRDIIIECISNYTGKDEKTVAQEYGLKRFKVTCEDNCYYTYHISASLAKNEARGEGEKVISVQAK